MKKFQIFPMTTLVIMIAMTFTSNSQLSAAMPQNAVLEITCELDRAACELKDELKCHFRRVRGYGVMLGYTAQIRGRANTIERRFSRDCHYGSLDRDVAKVSRLADQLHCRLQEILDCPDTLSRAEGDFSCIIARVKQICSLSRSLELATRPFCVEVHAVEVGSGHLRAARPNYSGIAPAYTVPRSQGWGNQRDLSRDPFLGRGVEMIPSQPLVPQNPYTAPRQPQWNPGNQQLVPGTAPRATSPRLAPPELPSVLDQRGLGPQSMFRPTQPRSQWQAPTLHGPLVGSDLSGRQQKIDRIVQGIRLLINN